MNKGMGFLFSPVGDPSWVSHSEELVPALDAEDCDLCRRICLPRVLGGDGVAEKPCLPLGSFGGVRCSGETIWGGGGTRRTREPQTFLRGESIVVLVGSTAREANVLEDQRLRKCCVDSDS